jgi:predicted  nucleic acid-binding Zn-ribbon protein
MIDAIGNMQMAIDRVKALNNQSIKNPKSEKMNFEKLNSLIGVKSPTSEVLAQANAELTLAGITSARIVSEEAIAAQVAEAAANATLSADLETANAALQTAQADLATVQENLNTAQSEIVQLQSKVEAFGKNAGATHSGSTGPDENADTDEVDGILDALPHNRKADQLFN